MPGNPHPIDVDIIDAVDVAKGDIRGYVKRYTRINVADANELRSIDFTAQVGGILIGGAMYDLDPDDTTSADDGVLTIIDAAGNRFMIVNADMLASISFSFDGLGSVMTTGIGAAIEVPFDCTIAANRIAGDVSGSAVVDLWKQTFAQYLTGAPNSGNSICGSSKPTVSGARASQDTTLSGWSTSLLKGDWITPNVNSVASFTRATLSLSVIKALAAA